MKIEVIITGDPEDEVRRDAIRYSTMDLALLGAHSIQVQKGSPTIISAGMDRGASSEEEQLDVLQKVFHPHEVRVAEEEE